MFATIFKFRFYYKRAWGINRRTFHSGRSFSNCDFTGRLIVIMASDIAFEQIQDNYWYGAYDQFRVVMMKDNGYINVTKMCVDGGKRFHDWCRLKATQELIKAYKNLIVVEFSSAGIPVEENSQYKFIQTRNKSPVDQLISGTYIHPDLAAAVAGWVSPVFHIKMLRVMKGYIATQYNMQLATKQQE